MKKPNFFIIGAPIFGTTALQNYLRGHSEIFMPRKKEFHYFATDLIGLNDLWRSMNHYLEVFQRAAKERLIGKASLFYLYSRMAARNKRQRNPHLRIFRDAWRHLLFIIIYALD